METIKKYYRVDRKEIAYIKFILEAYDGIAVLKTVNPGKGVIELMIAPGCENDVDAVMRDLEKTILIEPQLHSE